MTDTDILIDIIYLDDGPELWYYFRGCPEIHVHIRPWNDATVIVEHMQKDSLDDWHTEHDGPEMSTKSSLYDMIYAGIRDGLIGKGYAGAEAIHITELPKSSQEFILNTLNLKDYVELE